MGIFSSAAKVLRRGVKSVMGKPLSYEDMSSEQLKNIMDIKNKATKPLEEENAVLKNNVNTLNQNLKSVKRANWSTLGKSTAIGAGVGAVGTLGTQAYLKKKRREELARRRLIRAAIEHGNLGALNNLQ